MLFRSGELVTFHEKRIEDYNLAEVAGRVTFQQADACNLKPLYSGYDLVLASNLIDRLYNPRQFLDRIAERIEPGGLLVIASPYSWDTEFTEREAWLAGFRKDGEPYRTLEALHDALDETFEMEGDPVDMPFVLRETARKYQHTISEVTVWRRR